MKTIPCLILSGIFSIGILVGQPDSDLRPVSASPQGRPREITVTIFNLARIRKTTLERAQGVVAGIFRGYEIGIEWREGSDSDPDAHTIDMHASPVSGPCRTGLRKSVLLLRLIGQSQELGSETLALALPCARFGIDVTVAADRIEALAKQGLADHYLILGHVMAHEIGHVLLQSTEHAATGLMRAKWSRQDWRRIALANLSFTREEGERMRR
jgi:hypothetical protein